jgi:hypothetical protein
MAGAATTMVGYQNASLYKNDHPCRVSLLALLAIAVGVMRLGFLS